MQQPGEDVVAVGVGAQRVPRREQPAGSSPGCRRRSARAGGRIERPEEAAHDDRRRRSRAGIVTASEPVSGAATARCGSAAALGAGPSGAVASQLTAIADPRVEDGVEQVRDEVRDHGDDGEDEDAWPATTGMSRCRIACSSILADAGQREDLLDDHGAPMSVPRFRPTIGDQAERRVAEGVPQQHLPRADALGPRRRHVVLALHLVDQVAAQEAGVEAEQREPDREPPAGPATCRLATSPSR